MVEGGWMPEFCLLDDREGPLAQEFRRLGIPIHHCSRRPQRLWRLIRGGRYPVVHSHVLLFSGFVAAVAQAAGTPVRIVHAHNTHDGRGQGVLRQAYRSAMRLGIGRCATHALACSADAQEFLDCPAEWLPYGVDLQPFLKPRKLLRRTDFGIPADALVVGHVGRLTKQKNQAFLLEVFSKAATQEPRLHLAIAGEGSLAGELRGQAQAFECGERIHFLGRRGDIAALLTGLFDAFAMPSLHEGLPVALLEAQAAGLPCLTSDRIGVQAFVLPEMIETLSLETPAHRWAARMLNAVRRGRLPRHEAVRRMTLAGFDSKLSGERLVGFYERAFRAAHGGGESLVEAPFSS
jgi:glycosyltransferase involved in cell wall biosynthesis